MNENKTVQTESQEVVEDFTSGYSKRVHIIGRSTMAIALVLTFLPVLYLNFVKGYRAPLSAYLGVIAMEAAMHGGDWIAEPFTWFPMLGAAPLYMGYLSGNAKSLRVPVAKSVQSRYGVSVETPRGQVITTIGVAVSVFVNIILLAIVVMIGSVLIPKLPPFVLSSFNYVIPALIGSLLSMYISGYGFTKVLRWGIPALLVFIMIKLNLLPLSWLGFSYSVATSVLIGYIVFVMEGKKEKEKAENSSK